MTSLKTNMMLLLAVLCLAQSLGCIACGCDDDEEFTTIESGDYTITNYSWGPDEQQWMIGARLTIDREAELVILRYTREETTYEVHYTLEL